MNTEFLEFMALIGLVMFVASIVLLVVIQARHNERTDHIQQIINTEEGNDAHSI